MGFDPAWVENDPTTPPEPLRAVLETLGSRIIELETRARSAEERAANADANCSLLHQQIFEERQKAARLKAERDAAVSDYFARRPKADELERRIVGAVDVLVEHPRSGAKALAVLRGEAD